MHRLLALHRYFFLLFLSISCLFFAFFVSLDFSCFDVTLINNLHFNFVLLLMRNPIHLFNLSVLLFLIKQDVGILAHH